MMACAADLEYREKRRFSGGNGSAESGCRVAISGQEVEVELQDIPDPTA